MRVAMVGGYQGSREQRLWAALAGTLTLAGFGVALLVCDSDHARGHPTFLRFATGLAAVIVAFSVGRPVARLLRSVRSARREQRVVADLLSGLSDDYWLINDVPLGLAHGTIDHVLIGPCGIVVIETKQLAGNIRCWGNSWSVDGDQRPSISRHANAAACAVRYFLSERHPELAASALRWVESIIVFTHPLSHVEASDAGTTVVRYSQLYQTVLDLSRRQRFAPPTAALLARTLAGSHGRDGAGMERSPLTSAS